jgi:CheY-like chemotaxis protein
VILITGYPSVETSVPAIRLAVVAYLIKPVAPNELLELVRQTLEQRRACRSVEENLHRVEQWHRDLQTVGTSLRPKSPDAFNQAVGTFLNLTLRNVIDALADIRNTIQTLLSSPPSPEIIRAMESSRPIMLVGALQDTIRVIEHTKVNFRSKELGELRERLEVLLQDASVAAPAPSHKAV